MNKFKDFEIEYLIKNINNRKNYKNKICDLCLAIFCFLIICHVLAGPFMVIRTIDLYPYIMSISLVISIFIFINNLNFLKKEKVEINKEIKNIEKKYNVSKHILEVGINSLESLLKRENINIKELNKEELELLFLNILKENELITNKS